VPLEPLLHPLHDYRRRQLFRAVSDYFAIFPFWVTDLLIVSIVSAAMSSMHSVLLVASLTLYKNIIALSRAVKSEVASSRLAVVGFACTAAQMALNPSGDIVGITIFSGSLSAPLSRVASDPGDILRGCLAKPALETAPETGYVAKAHQVPDTLYRQTRIGQVTDDLLFRLFVANRLEFGSLRR
jgi:hypothetical protein